MSIKVLKLNDLHDGSGIVVLENDSCGLRVVGNGDNKAGVATEPSECVHGVGNGVGESILKVAGLAVFALLPFLLLGDMVNCENAWVMMCEVVWWTRRVVLVGSKTRKRSYMQTQAQ